VSFLFVVLFLFIICIERACIEHEKFFCSRKQIFVFHFLILQKEMVVYSAKHRDDWMSLCVVSQVVILFFLALVYTDITYSIGCCILAIEFFLAMVFYTIDENAPYKETTKIHLQCQAFFEHPLTHDLLTSYKLDTLPKLQTEGKEGKEEAKSTKTVQKHNDEAMVVFKANFLSHFNNEALSYGNCYHRLANTKKLAVQIKLNLQPIKTKWHHDIQLQDPIILKELKDWNNVEKACDYLIAASDQIMTILDTEPRTQIEYQSVLSLITMENSIKTAKDAAEAKRAAQSAEFWSMLTFLTSD
jgi:hypothetical protein